MRKKDRTRKMADSRPPPMSVPQTDFSQLIDCPEFVPGQAFGSHTGNNFLLEQTALSVGYLLQFTYLCKSLFRLRKLKII